LHKGKPAFLTGVHREGVPWGNTSRKLLRKAGWMHYNLIGMTT
jgi:hypothetical protein